jgi:hypothetical protein
MKGAVRGMPNAINFREFFQVKEAITVAAMTRHELPPDYVRSVKMAVRDGLGRVAGLNKRFVDGLANYFCWLYGSEQVTIDHVPTKLAQDWDVLGAYLTAYSHDNMLNSRLRSTTYSRTQVVADSQRYHRQLAFSDRRFDKGPEGQTVVDVASVVYDLFSKHPEVILSLPRGDQRHWAYENWLGWAWKSLGTGYSRAEGAAGGHCGNSGKKKGDVILSLRDAEDRVHLTFVCNGGALGEMKAAGNTKPSSIYHPAICALLASPYVNKVEGGGYMPEVNFDLADLPNEDIKALVSKLLDKEPAAPENVRTVEYLSTFTQQMVDESDEKAKKSILRDVLNIFDDLDYGEDVEPAAGYLQFDLTRLIWDVLPTMRYRELDEVWESLAEIENKVNSQNFKRQNKALPPLGFPVDEGLLVGVGDAVMDKATTLKSSVKFLDVVFKYSYKRPALMSWARERMLDMEGEVRDLAHVDPALWQFIGLAIDSAYEDYARFGKQHDDDLVALGKELAALALPDGLTTFRPGEEVNENVDSVWQSYLWNHLHERHDMTYTLDWDNRRAVWLTWDVRNVAESETSKAMNKGFLQALYTSTHLINKRTMWHMQDRFLRAANKLVRPMILKELSRRVSSTFSDVIVCHQQDGNEGPVEDGKYRMLYDGLSLMKKIENNPSELVSDYVRKRHAITDMIKEIVQRYAKNAAGLFHDNLDEIRRVANLMSFRRH